MARQGAHLTPLELRGWLVSLEGEGLESIVLIFPAEVPQNHLEVNICSLFIV